MSWKRNVSSRSTSSPAPATSTRRAVREYGVAGDSTCPRLPRSRSRRTRPTRGAFSTRETTLCSLSVERISMPPARSTRASSRTAAGASSTCSMTCEQSTRSNSPSANGSDSRFARRSSGLVRARRLEYPLGDVDAGDPCRELSRERREVAPVAAACVEERGRRELLAYEPADPRELPVEPGVGQRRRLGVLLLRALLVERPEAVGGRFTQRRLRQESSDLAPNVSP